MPTLGYITCFYIYFNSTWPKTNELHLASIHCITLYDLPLVSIAVNMHVSSAPNSWHWNFSLKRVWNGHIIFTVDCTFLA